MRPRPVRAIRRRSAAGLAVVALVTSAGCQKVPPNVPGPVVHCDMFCADHILEFGYDGTLSFTTRTGPGAAERWSPWTTPTTDGRPYPNDIDIVYNRDDHESYQVFTLKGALPVVGRPPSPGIGDIGYLRRKADGSQTSTLALNISGGLPRNFSRVSAAVVNHQLHVCGLTGGSINVEARNRTSPGDTSEARTFLDAWVDPAVKLGPFNFVDVGCAGVYNPKTATDDLHVLGVTKEGLLLRTVHPGSVTVGTLAWSPWEDVETSLGRDLGEFVRVDAAARPLRAHLAVTAVANDGRVWYIPDRGGWGAPHDVVADVNLITAPFTTIVTVDEVAAAFCDADVPPRRGADDDWELNIVLRVPATNRLLHTILAGVSTQWGAGPGGGAPASPSLWKPFTDLTNLTGYNDMAGRRHLEGFTISEQSYPATPTSTPTPSPS